jgi:F-type H+-transporting ATPase subunit delta
VPVPRAEPAPIRAARDRAEEAFTAAASEDALARVRDELYSLARLLRTQSLLRKSLGDITVPPEAREALLRDLLADRVHRHTLGLVVALAAEDALAWRLARVLEELAIQAVLAQAEHDGSLADAEDELFRFAKALEAQPRLLGALTDPVLPTENKLALVDDLLRGRASEATVLLVRDVVARGGNPLEQLHDLAERAAARRNRVVVEARTAVPLDDERRARLSDVLARALGREVDIEVVVDPSVVGGVVARVGDELIDGSVRRKLDLAMERLTG